MKAVLAENAVTRQQLMPPSHQAVAVPQIDKASLQTAFEQFNRLSAQLSDSYLVLERQLGVLHDELEHERAERHREHDEKVLVSLHFDTLLDILPGGVVVLDQTGTVVQANPAAIDLLGEPLMGERWINVIARSFAPRRDDGHEISLRDGRRVSISTRSLGDQPGQIILLTDQTDTRALQAKLSRQQRLVEMGRMMSSLAHQIRTPLAAAMLYASHLANTELSPQQTEKFSKKILARLNHLEQQVKDMLLFVRGTVPLDDCISLSQLFAEIEAIAEVEFGRRRVHLRVDNGAAQMHVRCNTSVLTGAVVNLLNNALQSTTKEISIILASKKTGDHVEISVVDNGPGIDAITLEKMQEAFFTTKPQGTGLGLAVVRSIANAHRGEFILDSTPGAGTAAKIVLPVYEMSNLSDDLVEESFI